MKKLSITAVISASLLLGAILNHALAGPTETWIASYRTARANAGATAQMGDYGPQLGAFDKLAKVLQSGVGDAAKTRAVAANAMTTAGNSAETQAYLILQNQRIIELLTKIAAKK